MYVRPGLTAAHADGLGALGQYIYVDALVMHGPGPEPTSFDGIRSEVLGSTAPPSRGGDETDYLEAFLDRRQWAMEQEDGHRNTSRVEAQRAFLREGNLGLTPPLSWTMYGDRYQIAAPPGTQLLLTGGRSQPEARAPNHHVPDISRGIVAAPRDCRTPDKTARTRADVGTLTSTPRGT